MNELERRRGAPMGRSETSSIVAAQREWMAVGTARARLRSLLNAFGEVFGEPVRRSLETKIEDLEEHASEAVHYFEERIGELERELLRLANEADNSRRNEQTIRSALRQAVDELDRRDRRSRREPSDLVVSLHEILAEPIEPF